MRKGLAAQSALFCHSWTVSLSRSPAWRHQNRQLAPRPP